MEKISWIKAAQDFFTKPPHGRKLEIPEFKELTPEDRLELREMLIAEGYNVAEVGEKMT